MEIVEYPTKSAELNIALNANGDNGTPETAPLSKSAVAELAFPSGLVRYDEKGNEQSLSINFNGEYRGPDTGGVWKRWPSGTRGYAGDHFRISGGVLSGRDQLNPNDPASVDIVLDRYELEKGSFVFVRLVFKQETFYIRPQTDMWFKDSAIDAVEPGFDFNETPDPNTIPGYDPSWILVTGDQPAKGVFVIREGFEYGFQYFVPNKNGYYVCQTNLQNFKDAPPPDGYSFPAQVINSRQCYVGNLNAGGDVDEPPISSTLYSREAGKESYLQTIESRSWVNGEPGIWEEWDTSSTLLYLGVNYPVELQLVEEYKGTLKDVVTMDPIDGYAIQIRHKFYALKMSPQNTSGRLVGPGLFFEPNIPDFQSAAFNVSGRELTPGRVSIVIPFKQEGRYDIKIQRVGDNENNTGDDRYIDKCSWVRLTSRGYPAAQIDGRRGILNLKKRHTMTEVRFQSSENVQGNVQQISATARCYMRWHDGKQWREPRVAGA